MRTNGERSEAEKFRFEVNGDIYAEHRSNADHFRFYVNGAYGERSETEKG